MSRPLSIAELHSRTQRTKANLLRKQSSSRCDSPSLAPNLPLSQGTKTHPDIFASSVVNTVEVTATSDHIGQSEDNIIHLNSGDFVDGPIVTLSTTPTEKHSSEKQPNNAKEMTMDEKVDDESELAFRLCLAALQIPVVDADKEPVPSKQERRDGEQKHSQSKEKICLSRKPQGLRSGEHDQKAESVRSGSSKIAASNGSSIVGNYQRNRGRSADKASSRPRSRSSSRPRSRSTSRDRMRSNSRPRMRSSSRPRARSRTRSRRSNSRPRDVSKGRIGGNSHSRKRSRSTSRKTGRILKRSKSPILSKELDLALRTKKLDASLGSLIQNSARALKQQEDSLSKTSSSKVQAVDNAPSSGITVQLEGVLQNGEKRKELSPHRSITPEKVVKPFSAEVKRFLEIFNLSGLDPTDDEDSVDGRNEEDCAENGPKQQSPAPEVEAATKQQNSLSQVKAPPQEECEMIQDILKSIGLNIGVTEIGQLSVRALERRAEGKGPSNSPERPMSESSTYPSQPAVGLTKSSENELNPLMLDGLVKGNEMERPMPPSVLGGETNAPVLGSAIPAPLLEQHSAPVHSAPPIVNIHPPVPTYIVPGYGTAPMPPTYGPPPPENSTTYTHYGPPPGWPLCPPPQQHNLISAPPPPPIPPPPHAINALPNLGAAVSMQLHPVQEPLSDEKNEEFQKQKVITERLKLKADRENLQKKIVFLQKEVDHIRKKMGELHHVKHPPREGHKDSAVEERKRAHDYLLDQLTILKKEDTLASEKQSELDTVAEILGIDIGKTRKQTERKRERSRSQEKSSRRERSRSREKSSKRERSRSQEKNSIAVKSRKMEKPKSQTKRSKRERSISRDASLSPITDSCPSPKSYEGKTSKPTKPLSDTAVQSAGLYEYYDAGNHWCRECNTFCGTLLDYFSHMHHKKHQQTLDPDARPWASKSEGETKEDAVKSPNKITIPAKGSEFMVPLSGFYCTLCGETFEDPIRSEQHIKCYSHNNQYKKYLERHLLYEERRNLDRQAGMAAATEAKRRREREMKRKGEETTREDEKAPDPKVARNTNDFVGIVHDKGFRNEDSSQKSVISNAAQLQVLRLESENNEKLQTLSKNETMIAGPFTAGSSAGKDINGSTRVDNKTTNPVQVGKLKPITLTFAKKPVICAQAKIRPNLPVPSIVQRPCSTTSIGKPAPLNTFLSIKSGLCTKPLPLLPNVCKPNVVDHGKPKATDGDQTVVRKTESVLKALVSDSSSQPQKARLRVAVEHRVGVVCKTKKDLPASETQETSVRSPMTLDQEETLGGSLHDKSKSGKHMLDLKNSGDSLPPMKAEQTSQMWSQSDRFHPTTETSHLSKDLQLEPTDKLNSVSTETDEIEEHLGSAMCIAYQDRDKDVFIGTVPLHPSLKEQTIRTVAAQASNLNNISSLVNPELCVTSSDDPEQDTLDVPMESLVSETDDNLELQLQSRQDSTQQDYASSLVNPDTCVTASEDTEQDTLDLPLESQVSEADDNQDPKSLSGADYTHNYAEEVKLKSQIVLGDRDQGTALTMETSEASSHSRTYVLATSLLQSSQDHPSLVNISGTLDGKGSTAVEIPNQAGVCTKKMIKHDSTEIRSVHFSPGQAWSNHDTPPSLDPNSQVQTHLQGRYPQPLVVRLGKGYSGVALGDSEVANEHLSISHAGSEAADLAAQRDEAGCIDPALDDMLTVSVGEDSDDSGQQEMSDLLTAAPDQVSGTGNPAPSDVCPDSPVDSSEEAAYLSD